MSTMDFLQGQQFGQMMSGIHGSAAEQRAGNKIDAWMEYAKKLEAELRVAKLTVARDSALVSATVDVARELRERIQTLAPNDPLGRQDVILRKRLEIFTRAVEKQGYRVSDPTNLVISTR